MNILELFAPVRTFVFDIDGVLTDGMIQVTDEGHILRSLNIRDGYAMRQAVKKGYRVWIISAARSQPVRQRLLDLGVNDVRIGVDDKKVVLEQMAESYEVEFSKMLYMGDDIPDHAAMQLCMLPCCPADAVPEIKSIAKYISPRNGGAGCVRDVIEKVMKLNGDWELPE